MIAARGAAGSGHSPRDSFSHDTPFLDWNAEFRLPNLDSVNHCTSRYLFISILISLVQFVHEQYTLDGKRAREA